MCVNGKGHNMIIVKTDRWQGYATKMPMSLRRILGVGGEMDNGFWKVRSDFYECHWCPAARILYSVRSDSGNWSKLILMETVQLEEVKNDG